MAGYIEEIKKDKQDYPKLAAKHNFEVMMAKAIINPTTQCADLNVTFAELNILTDSLNKLGFANGQTPKAEDSLPYGFKVHPMNENDRNYRVEIYPNLVQLYLDQKYPPSVSRTRIT